MNYEKASRRNLLFKNEGARAMNYDELKSSGKIDHFYRMARKKIELLISMKGEKFLGFGDVTNDYVCMSFTDDKCYVSMHGRVTWL